MDPNAEGAFLQKWAHRWFVQTASYSYIFEVKGPLVVMWKNASDMFAGVVTFKKNCKVDLLTTRSVIFWD